MRNRNVQEVYDEEGKPFWMKFLKADYLGESLPKEASFKQKGMEMSKKIEQLTEKEEKMRRELDKIRKLDAELAQKSKI